MTNWEGGFADTRPSEGRGRKSSPSSVFRTPRGRENVGNQQAIPQSSRRLVFDPESRFQNPRSLRQRRGSILLLVLFIIPVLALGAYSFTHWMRAEAEGAVTHLELTQARWLAHSGIERVQALLSDPALLEPGAVDLVNSPEEFARVVVTSTFRNKQGAFSIVAPPLVPTSRDIRYGLENESAKIPLHRRQMLLRGDPDEQRERLMQLPNMTPEAADGILDWIDKDDEPREFGAEADYYLSLANPYSPRNAPPRTIGELLLVKGVTPWLLYGEDANLNGLLDANEDDGAKTWPPDNADGVLDRGWHPFLTVYSAASNLAPNGEPKINLNENLRDHRDTLVDLFGEEWFAFVEAFKRQEGRKRIKAISELIDAKVQPRQSQKGGRGRTGRGARQDREPIQSPWTSENAGEYLDTALQYLTTETTKKNPAIVRGRIDVTGAPREVIFSLPGLSPESADAVAAAAQDRPAGDLSAAWLLTEGHVDLEEFQKVEPYLTTQGRVFRVESVGFFIESGPMVRVQAIVDASQSPAKVRWRRELLNLPVGYPREVLAEAGSYIPEPRR